MSVLLAADSARWYADLTFWAFFAPASLATIAGIWVLMQKIFHERIGTLERKLADAKEELKNGERTPPESADLEGRLASSERLRGQAEAQTAQLQRKIDAVNDNLRTAGRLGGLTWRANVADDAPVFVGLAERRAPIVAVLNLKGGVGKTTVTANLGAALARDDWRVLLVDLDLQASLTSMLIDSEQLQQASRGRRLVQHFVDRAANGAAARFADYLLPTRERGIELVGSSDALAYAELNLTVRWFLQPGRDVRLLLREALHGHVADRFDAVLIDCPPILNVSCVNALAAADFVLIPVMPSKSSTDRVAPMLVNLRALRGFLNPDLKILGVVANRTFRAKGLTNEEQNLWNALRSDCHTAWGEPVPMCLTPIPQSVEIRAAESARRPLDAGEVAFASFQQLAAELTPRFPPVLARTITAGAGS